MNITERSEMDKLFRAFIALRNSGAQLQTVIEMILSLDGWRGSTGGVKAFLSRQWRENSTQPREEADGSGQEVIAHSGDAGLLLMERQDTLAFEPMGGTDLRARFDDEYMWFLVRAVLRCRAKGMLINRCGNNSDIDDIGQSEARLNQVEEKSDNEKLALREEIESSSMFEEMVGSSEPIRRVLKQLVKVAPSDSTVLLLGETGTGKELFARALHRRSSRSTMPFVQVNCAAIPQPLIASELFGHEKGAFTGALQRRLGRFEAAQGGTLFLDEVGELPAETQIALLRVLQEREIERVGSNRPIPMNVRVIAATNRNLREAVADGTFRQDLFYRLNVFPILVPSLRERRADIPLLVKYFIERYARKAGKKIERIGKETLDLCKAYDWPGNVRELQNIVERAVILCESDTFFIDESWVKRDSTPSEEPVWPLAALAEREKELIKAALAKCNGRISGPAGAATLLRIPRSTLESKLARLGINQHLYKRRNASQHVPA